MWSNYSPDLNPIKKLQNNWKRQLNEYKKAPKEMFELQERVEWVRDKISPETCQKLIKIMSRRIYAVNKAKN